MKASRQGFPLVRGCGVEGEGEERKGLIDEIKKLFSFLSQDMIISVDNALGYSDHLILR